MKISFLHSRDTRGSGRFPAVKYPCLSVLVEMSGVTLGEPPGARARAGRCAGRRQDSVRRKHSDSGVKFSDATLGGQDGGQGGGARTTDGAMLKQ